MTQFIFSHGIGIDEYKWFHFCSYTCLFQLCSSLNSLHSATSPSKAYSYVILQNYYGDTA